MKQSKLTIEMLRKALDYDPATGVFTWKQPVTARVTIGERAGALGSNGRRYIGILGEKHSAHRLAWFYRHGVWPQGNVRQRNGDYDDASLDNLIEETPEDLARRGTLRSTNTSGARGVSWSHGKQKWLATITRGGKRKHIGYFADLDEAKAAYDRVAAIGEFDGGADVPTTDQIAERRRLRAVWTRLLRQGVPTAWSSFSVFVLDLQSALDSHEIVALDASKPIGPGNWAWTPVPERPKKPQRKSMIWRERDLQKNFGIDLADYQRMFVEQEGACAICRQPETEKRNGKAKWLAVDHDHTTGAVRGLLCVACNTGIGKLGDDPARLRAAATYLESHAAAANVVPLKKETA
jgi:hypothetical protein